MHILKQQTPLIKPRSWPRTGIGSSKLAHKQSDSKRRNEGVTRLTKATAENLLPGETKIWAPISSKNPYSVSFKPLYNAIAPRPHFLHNLRRPSLAHRVRAISSDIFDGQNDEEPYSFFQLQGLANKKRHAQAAKYLRKLLEDPNYTIPIYVYFIPDYLIRGLRAGSIEDCLFVYDRVSKLIGVPSSSEHKTLAAPTPMGWDFYHDHEMTLAFVCHLVRLSERKPSKLEGWYRARFEENPRFFLEAAERVYNAYAIVHGFNRFDSGDYEVEQWEIHYTYTGVAIACLFELGRCELALDAFTYQFDRWAQKHGCDLNSQPNEDQAAPAIEACNSSPSSLNTLPTDSVDSDELSASFRPFYILDTVFPSMARRNLDYATQFLLEIAPARIPHFQPSSSFYEIVIHESLKKQKLDEAIRVLEHAKGVKNTSFELGSTIFHEFVRANLKNIRRSLKHELPGSERYIKPFACILDILGLLRVREKVDISMLDEAIELALAVGQPRVAWKIRLWGDKCGLFEQRKWVEAQEGLATSPQSIDIARALLTLHRRGLMEEPELTTKLNALGVNWVHCGKHPYLA